MGKAAVYLMLFLSVLASAFQYASPQPPSPKSYPSASFGTDYPWAMFHHDSLRTGATLASAPNGPNLSWSFTTGSNVYSSPAVANGIVFIPSYDGNLYAIDEYTGQQKWVFPTGAPIYASPAVANGMVYLASRDSFVYALNEQTGAMVWRVGNISPITSSPVVADGKVFYGTWFARFWAQLLAVDATSGNIIWQYLADDTIISSPAVHNGRVFFGQYNGFVVALNETTGAELWKNGPGGTLVIGTAPAVAYGGVFVGTDRSFMAFDELTGVVRWTFNTNNNNATSGAVNNGIVYFGTGRGNVHAVNATTGSQIWRYTVGSVVSSSPALALGSNVLLAGSHDTNLYALDMTTGAFLWRFATGLAVSSSPAVADGRVFFGSQDSKVYALGSQAPRLQVSLSSGKNALKPGELAALSITVTNGTSPQSGVALSLTSSAGGGFTAPVETSLGLYASNFTAPLVSSTTTSTIQVVATEAGYLDGSAQTTITLNPFPPLTVEVTPKPSAVTPGGEILLLIKVSNGTQPAPGASIYLTSTSGGSFSGLTDAGNGNYTVVYAASLQNSSPKLMVQASKPGFSPGQAEVTITISGVPDLTNIKILGVNLFILIIGLFLFFFVLVVVIVAKRKREPDLPSDYVRSYAVKTGSLPGRLI